MMKEIKVSSFKQVKDIVSVVRIPLTIIFAPKFIL